MTTRKKKMVITNLSRIRFASALLLIGLGTACFAVAQNDAAQDEKAQTPKSQDEVQSNQPEKKTAKNAEKSKEKPYGLIFGTAFGPDDRPVYGVKVTIHPADKKHPTWTLVSDHHGEFAQRVPPGPGDYVVNGEVEFVPVENGKPRASKKKRWTGAAKVHIDDQERHDFSLHLTE